MPSIRFFVLFGFVFHLNYNELCVEGRELAFVHNHELSVAVQLQQYIPDFEPADDREGLRYHEQGICKIRRSIDITSAPKN